MSDIIELQRKLQEARNDPSIHKVRMRTAQLDDAAKLLKAGFSPEEITYFQNIPLAQVKAEQARLAERDRAKQRYLQTLNMEFPGKMAHVSIYEK